MAKTKLNILRYVKRGYKEMKTMTPWWTCLVSFIQGILLAILPYVNVIMMAKIVGVLFSSRNIKTLVIYCSITVGLNFFIAALTKIAEAITTLIVNTLCFSEQHKIDKLLLSVDYNQLESASFEELVRKYKESVQNSVGQLAYFPIMISAFVCSFLSFGIALYLIFPLLKFSFIKTGTTFVGSPYFILSLIGLVVIAAIFIFLLQKMYNKLGANINEEEFKLGKKLSYYIDVISEYKNGKEIRIFNMQNLIEKSASEELLTKGVQLRLRAAKKLGKNSAATAMIGVLIALGLYLFIGLKGLAGLFDISNLVLYLGSFLLLVSSIQAIVGRFSQMIFIVKQLRYYIDILDEAKITESPVTPTHADLTNDFQIEFRNVSFKYDEGSKYALKNLSLIIKKGDKIAIVGENGSGKTTLIKLLTKMYTEYEGEILLNGVDIKKINYDEYNNLFSVVFQDYQVFSFTVAENIAATDEYNKNKVLEVLKKAELLDHVNATENGIDNYVGKDYISDGADFSGGESQKMAIARAFYKSSECLILDEPTAALDPLAEAQFYSKFNQFSTNKTVLYISHRLSSCIFCERILVFHQGELVQNGIHTDLVKDIDKKYYELWNNQAQYYM